MHGISNLRSCHELHQYGQVIRRDFCSWLRNPHFTSKFGSRRAPCLARGHSHSLYQISIRTSFIRAFYTPNTFGLRALPPAQLRRVSWSAKPRGQPVEFNGLSDGEEDAAKAVILDKVMKGRQPTDLMLRCTFSELYDMFRLPNWTTTLRQVLCWMLMVRQICGYDRLFILRLHQGNVKTISGQFKKSDLCAEHRLNVSVLNAQYGVPMRMFSELKTYSTQSLVTCGRLIQGFRTWFPPF
jgi:hypothetical protein